MTRGAVREIGPLTRTDLVRYAGAAGDFNPLHHDDGYARDLGFPSVIAMGMLPAGMLGAFAAAAVRPASLTRLTVRFRRPIFPGDLLRMEVAAPSAGSADLTLTVAGEPRLIGTVEIDGAAAAEQRRPAEPTADERLDRILGMVVSPVRLPVEEGKIAEFARAVYADAGEVPPTFTACAAHWSGGDASELPRMLGLDLARVLHGEQRYCFHRPVRPGAVLYGTRAVLAATAEHTRRGDLLTLVTVGTTFADVDGPVVSEETVIVERATGMSQAPDPSPATASSRRATAGDP